MNSSKSEDSLRQSYKKTIVEIVRNNMIISDRRLYEIWKSDFYMITAANPFSRKLTDDENGVRNLELHSFLVEDHHEILAGIGKDSTGTWSEKGWVVCGGEERLILLAKKFGQNAIFKFTLQGREVIDCR